MGQEMALPDDGPGGERKVKFLARWWRTVYDLLDWERRTNLLPLPPFRGEKKWKVLDRLDFLLLFPYRKERRRKKEKRFSRSFRTQTHLSLSLSLSYKDFTASTEAGSANSEKTWPLLAAVEITRILYARYTIVFQEIFYNHIHGFRPRDDIYCTAFLRYVSECAVASTRLSRYRTISFLGRRNNRPRPPPPLSNPFDW